MQAKNKAAMIGLLLALACTLSTLTSAQAGPKAAIFPFELIDLSPQADLGGPRADETNRLKLATEELRKLAGRGAGYEVLDLSGIASDIENAAPLYKCDGCELDLARRIGAEVAITVAVRKFSNLLLSLHIYEREVSGGKLTKMYRVDIRGNTDESWLRGVHWLVARGLAGG